MEQVWLGHTRLSILDLSPRGHQPMTFAGERYRIVFNGEIYNFLELRRELEGVGYFFKGQTDTEIITAAYDRWGVECLSRFNGMWAFGIWDSFNKELWLARDRFGQKPLYYCQRGDDFVFASEVKTLHAWLGDGAELDPAVIRSICSGKFQWHGTERTYLNHVRALPAGHWLRKGKRDWRVHRWYRLEPYGTQVPKSFPEQTEEFRHLLWDACRLRLRSDVPVGTCLSGGIDSSSITAIIHKGLKNHGERSAPDYHQTFCAGFSGTSLDETGKAQRLADGVGADLRILQVHPPDGDRLLSAIEGCDGPMHSLAFYPIWELYGFIRRNGVKVTLDGHGADELMGGYFDTIREALQGALKQGRLNRFWDLYQTFRELGETPYYSSRKYARWNLRYILGATLSAMKRSLMALFDPPQETGNSFQYAQSLRGNYPPLVAELYRQFSQDPLPTILQQFDRGSMAHGVEGRMPFMDYRVVEFLFSLPEYTLIGEGFTKRILRVAVRDILSDSHRLDKTKIGFNAPIVEWFLGPLRQLILDTIHCPDFRQHEFFDGGRLNHQFHEWLKRPNWGDAWAFWPPVHFMLWRRSVKSQLLAKEDSTGPVAQEVGIGV